MEQIYSFIDSSQDFREGMENPVFIDKAVLSYGIIQEICNQTCFTLFFFLFFLVIDIFQLLAVHV